MKNLARNLLRSQADAEDAVEESFSLTKTNGNIEILKLAK
jgi:hypothetical protein